MSAPAFLHGPTDLDKLVQAIFDEFGMTANPVDLVRIRRQIERILPVTTEEKALRCATCNEPLKLCTKCMLWRKGKSTVKKKLYEAGPTLLSKLNEWLEDADDDRPQKEK